MGLFDSTCFLSGLSLAPLDRVACVPLVQGEDGNYAPRGTTVFGPSNRGGGIDAAGAPAEPHALFAGPVYDALIAQGLGLEAALGSLGVTLAPSSHDGAQHTDGDALTFHSRATRRFAEVPQILQALAECAEIAELCIQARLGREAPPANWLKAGASSWYGIVCGPERRASLTLEAFCADAQFLASFAYDGETLKVVGPMLAFVAQRGEVTELDLAPHLFVENGGRRARLSDTAEAEEVAGLDDEPRFDADRASLAASVPALQLPLAADGSLVFLGSPQFEKPAWAIGREGASAGLGAARIYWTTAYGLTLFARVVADGWKAPPPALPVTRLDSDAEIEAEIAAGRITQAILLYRKKTNAGIAEAKMTIEAWIARR